MGIKSCKSEPPIKKRTYPILLDFKAKVSGDGFTVLFWKEQCGVVIFAEKHTDWTVGKINDDWIMSYFRESTVPYTLENK